MQNHGNASANAAVEMLHCCCPLALKTDMPWAFSLFLE